jgi:hypothetical protein
MAKEEDGRFLKRWSQRKLEQAEAPEKDAAEEAARPADPEAEEARRRELEEYVRNLPDPESLDYESDFTAFFKEGVPDELRVRALRRLWRSNPALANLDGLIDYGGDYTNAAVSAGVVRTIYKVGRGMILDEEEKPKAPPAGEGEAVAQAESPAQAAPPCAPDAPDAPDADAPAPLAESAADTGSAPAIADDPPEAQPEGPRKPQGSALSRRWGAG